MRPPPDANTTGACRPPPPRPSRCAPVPLHCLPRGVEDLAAHVGAPAAALLSRMAAGVDPSPVVPRGPPKSLMCERSFPPLAGDAAALSSKVQLLASELVRRLLRHAQKWPRAGVPGRMAVKYRRGYPGPHAALRSVRFPAPERLARLLGQYSGQVRRTSGPGRPKGGGGAQAGISCAAPEQSSGRHTRSANSVGASVAHISQCISRHDSDQSPTLDFRVTDPDLLLLGGPEGGHGLGSTGHVAPGAAAARPWTPLPALGPPPTPDGEGVVAAGCAHAAREIADAVMSRLQAVGFVQDGTRLAIEAGGFRPVPGPGPVFGRLGSRVVGERDERAAAEGEGATGLRRLGAVGPVGDRGPALGEGAPPQRRARPTTADSGPCDAPALQGPPGPQAHEPHSLCGSPPDPPHRLPGCGGPVPGGAAPDTPGTGDPGAGLQGTSGSDAEPAADHVGQPALTPHLQPESCTTPGHTAPWRRPSPHSDCPLGHFQDRSPVGPRQPQPSPRSPYSFPVDGNFAASPPPKVTCHVRPHSATAPSPRPYHSLSLSDVDVEVLAELPTSIRRELLAELQHKTAAVQSSSPPKKRAKSGNILAYVRRSQP